MIDKDGNRVVRIADGGTLLVKSPSGKVLAMLRVSKAQPGMVWQWRVAVSRERGVFTPIG